MSTPRTVRLSPNDNVVVAVDPIAEGASAAGVTAKARVMRGHKMAVAPVTSSRRTLAHEIRTVVGAEEACLRTLVSAS